MIRALYKTDLNQILLIEQSVHVVPWTEETFVTCFQSGYIGWGVELDQKVIAFIIMSLRAEECHVLNLCVSREHQRKGYGYQLIAHALEHAKKEHAAIAYLEVRRSNLPAIELYKKMKFHMIGERKNYYPTVSGLEDALIFAKSLQQIIK